MTEAGAEQRMDLDGSGAVDDPLSDELPPAVPNSGVLFGIDYGERRIGIAVSNDEQTIAMQLENYTRINPERDAAWLRQLTSGYGVRGLVVGLPVHMSGEEGQKARQARQFGVWAHQATLLPVTWWDERYSSAAADVYLNRQEFTGKKRKARRDQLAAQVFLQSFLDSDDRTASPVALT